MPEIYYLSVLFVITLNTNSRSMKKFLLILCTIWISTFNGYSVAKYYIGNSCTKVPLTGVCLLSCGGTINWTALVAGCPGVATADIVLVDGVTLNINSATATCNSLSIGDDNTFSGTSTSSSGCNYCSVSLLGFNDNGSLTFSAGGKLTVTGAVTVQNGTGGTGVGTLSMANGYLKCASISYPASGGVYTYGASSTIELTGNNTLPTAAQCAAFTQVYNLILSGGTTTLGQALNIRGNLTLSGGILDVSASNYGVNMTGAGMIFDNNTSTGGLVPQAGTFTFSGSTTVQSTSAYSTQFYKVSITGTLTGSNAHVMKVKNDWANSGTFTHGSNTVEFNSTGAPYSTVSGVSSNTFYNIIVTNQLTSGGAGTNIYIEKNWTNNATFVANSGNVIFSAGNAQTLTGTVDPSYYNLQVNKTANTVFTLGRTPLTINNQLQMTLGTFDVGTNVLSSTAATFVADGAGEIRFARTGATLPELTGAYTVTDGTIRFYGNGAQTARSLSSTGGSKYYNLRVALSASSASVPVVSLAGNIVVAGSLTIEKNSGGSTTPTLDVVSGSNYEIRMIGTSSRFHTDGTFLAEAGTVKFDGTTTVGGATTPTFYDVTIASTGTGTMVGDSSNQVIRHNFANNGTFTHNSGRVSFDNPSATTGYITGTSVTPFYDLYIGSASASASYLLVSHPTEIQVAHDMNVYGLAFNSNYPVSGYGGDGKVTFNGSGTLTNTTTLELNHVKISGTITFPSTAPVRVFGDWDNNGTFNANSQLVNFRAQTNGGTNAAPTGTYRNQVIKGTSITTFYKLSYNNPGTSAGTAASLSLQTDAIVANQLDLRSGAFKLNTHTLTVQNGATNSGFTSGGIVKQGSADGAVGQGLGYLVSEDASLFDASHANNASKLAWTIAAANTGVHIIPFATSAGMPIPVTYDLISGNPGTLTVATFPTATNNLPYPINVIHVNDTTAAHANNSAYTANRFWDIRTSNSTVENLTFTYDDPTDVSGVTGGEYGSDGRGFIGQQWDNTSGGWLKYSTFTQTFNGVANTLSISSFNGALNVTRPWALALHMHPLPIQLLSFDVKLSKDREAEITWKTATEVNNKHFVVEKSFDGINFSALKTIKGAINSSSEKSYATLDEDPYEGLSYYRLKQVDLNDAFTFSNVVPFSNTQLLELLRFYPCPAPARATIEFNSQGEVSATLNIYTNNGKLVFTDRFNIEKGLNKYTLETATLTKGLYNFVLEAGENKYQGKFLKN